MQISKFPGASSEMICMPSVPPNTIGFPASSHTWIIASTLVLPGVPTVLRFKTQHTQLAFGVGDTGFVTTLTDISMSYFF